jgi:hypothetical protein
MTIFGINFLFTGRNRILKLNFNVFQLIQFRLHFKLQRRPKQKKRSEECNIY